MGKYEKIIDAGFAFIGIENTAEDVREFYASERPSVEKLAESIGVVLLSEIDDEYIVDVGGRTHISTSNPMESEYEKAIVVGSYLLYGQLPSDLSEERVNDVSLFAVTVIAPGLKDHVEGAPTPGDVIKLSRKFNVPFATLRRMFEIN